MVLGLHGMGAHSDDHTMPLASRAVFQRRLAARIVRLTKTSPLDQCDWFVSCLSDNGDKPELSIREKRTSSVPGAEGHDFRYLADSQMASPRFRPLARKVLSRRPARGGMHMRILIVDDSATMRRIIRNNLKAMGYEAVVEAENGQSALAKIASDAIEFVIADWSMPVMDGLELVKAIRSSPKHAKLPVLMITAADQEDHIVQAIQANVNGYIVKPFEPEVLTAKIQQILNGAAKA
jgi:two-component system, chemotaxis family, chemotaxis protein CheY